MLTKFKRMKPIKKVGFAILIAFAVVSFWRGVWGLMDTYLFPNDYLVSLWVSLVIGLVILIGTHYATKELM